MTIAVASLEANGLAMFADTKISGGASTEAGAKVFALPVDAVKASGRGFKPLYRTALGFAFSGSTLAALNTHAFVAACCSNLVAKDGAVDVSVEEVASFLARAALHMTSDVASRSVDGRRDPRRYFFNALLGGYCARTKRYELYQIEPFYDGLEFDVQAHRMELSPERMFPIGSGTEALVALSDEMAVRGYKRGAYGAMELLLALGGRDDVGGWIQYGLATPGNFQLRPTMKPIFGAAHAQITFMGQDILDIGAVGGFAVGHQVVGPQPPIDWLAKAVATWR